MAKSFNQAFAEARKKLGAGKTFTWNGKSYSTNYAEEGKKTKPMPRPDRPAPAAKPAPASAKAERESSAPLKPTTKPVSRPPVPLSPKEMVKLTPAQRAERNAQAMAYRTSLRKSKS